MVRLGFHISIGGGFVKAARTARGLGCRTMQIFTRNPRGWTIPKAIDPDAAAAFRALLVRYDIAPLVVHMPYLPNLASPDETLHERSVAALTDELARARLLGASFLVLHVGHRGNAAEEEAFARVADAINRSCRFVPPPPLVLLENTAGQGTEIGSRFEDLARIMTLLEDRDRMGICLDTAHAWGAGYDLSTAAGLEATLEEFDRHLGWERLRLIHLNDARADRSSRVDRHDHIGEGRIGREGLRLLLHDPRLSTLPFIMETPKKTDADDEQNMRVVQELMGE
jgi:deoxyribonuclease-4